MRPSAALRVQKCVAGNVRSSSAGAGPADRMVAGAAVGVADPDDRPATSSRMPDL